MRELQAGRMSYQRSHPAASDGIIRDVPVLVMALVALVVFGAFVLLRFPDRPGGTIRWHGVEVSSVGGGLPLSVLGVVAIATGTLRGPGETAGTGGTEGATGATPEPA